MLKGAGMRLIVRIVGFIFFALVVAGFCLDIVSALRAGRPFYGQNYQMLDLGTYSSAAVVIVALSVGLLAAIRWLVRKARR
jgi:hypothetical protein